LLPSSRIVLASGSPRRESLLRQLGLDFEVVVADIVEPGPEQGEAPADWVQRSATLKASSVARQCPDVLVIGADTAVVVEGHVLGKPRDANEAAQMLARLSGRTHDVLTGLALVAPAGEICCACEATRVTFRSLSLREIDAYVRSGEPMDKAGAYGIQGRAALFVTRLEGCYFNVVGLPLARLGTMLEHAGISVHRHW
jgi:septum formation protein